MSNTYPTEGTSPSTPNSTMAMVSLISGILGLTILPTIGSIVALVTGYMAKKEIRKSEGTLGGDGMATIGLILGWVGVAILLIGICITLVVIALIAFGIYQFGTETFLPGILVAAF